MSSERRSLRLGESLHKTLVELLLREVKDPRCASVTITAVRLSADLSHAWVYFHCMGDKQAQDRCLAGLQSAGGFLRAKLGKAMRVRKVPALRFCLDPTFENFPNSSGAEANDPPSRSS